jgi:hypothetical protein
MEIRRQGAVEVEAGSCSRVQKTQASGMQGLAPETCQCGPPGGPQARPALGGFPAINRVPQ